MDDQAPPSLPPKSHIGRQHDDDRVLGRNSYAADASVKPTPKPRKPRKKPDMPNKPESEASIDAAPPKPKPSPRPRPRPRPPKDDHPPGNTIALCGATEDESSTDSCDIIVDPKPEEVDIQRETTEVAIVDTNSNIPDYSKRSDAIDTDSKAENENVENPAEARDDEPPTIVTTHKDSVSSNEYEPIWFSPTVNPNATSMSTFIPGPPKPPRESFVPQNIAIVDNLYDTPPPSFPPPPLPAAGDEAPPPVPPRKVSDSPPNQPVVEPGSSRPPLCHSAESVIRNFDPLAARQAQDETTLDDSFEKLLKESSVSKSSAQSMSTSVVTNPEDDQEESYYDMERTDSDPLKVLAAKFVTPHRPAPAVPCLFGGGLDYTDDDDNSTGVLDSCESLSDGGNPLDGDDDAASVDHQKRIPIIPKTPTVRNHERCGYLYKNDANASPWTWLKRWVVFNGDDIRYYEDKKSMVSKRIIPVATVKNVENDIKLGDSKQYRFKVITVDGRVYVFAADTVDDLSLWTSTLMQSIISCRGSIINLGDGLTMHDPDKQGFLKIQGLPGKMFIAIKGDKLCYYKNYDDYKVGSPIHQIDMQLCAVKDLGKNKIQLMTSYKNFILCCDSNNEMSQWKKAMEEAIAESISDDTYVKQLYENEDNKTCADCGADNPTWVSFNFGIVICKRCAGIHRNLPGNTIHKHVLAPKVRSATLDIKIWTPTNIKLFLQIGNANANSFWAGNLSEFDRIYPDSDSLSRQQHIEDKYVNKKFCRFHHHYGNQHVLDEALCHSVQTDDIVETMILLYSGAEMTYTTEKYSELPMTAYQLAEASGKRFQMDYLGHNGAEVLENGGQLEELDDYSRRTVSHKGFLHKTGSNMKDFHRRWCILERGSLSYYLDDKSSTAKDTIQCREMLNVGISDRVGKYEHCFEVGTRKCDNRVYLFAADTEEEKMAWMKAIAKSFCPPDVASSLTDFDRCGNLYIKHGKTGDWFQCFLQVKGKHLFIFDSVLNEISTVDLRKVSGLTQHEDDEETCSLAVEGGLNFIIDLPGGRALYMQGCTRVETESWWNWIKKTVSEGGKALDEQQLTHENIPVIIDKCIEFVATHGMEEEGIYRRSGTNSKINNLLTEFAEDSRSVHLKLEDYEVHDITNCMKRYLRTLSDPLLTSSLHEKWVNTAGIADHASKLQWYKYLLKELPEINYCTLKKLVLHLKDVAKQEPQNRMSATNLASLFGPTTMKLDDEEALGFGDTNSEIRVMVDLIAFHEALFELRDTKMETEMKIEQAKKDIEEAMKQKSPGNAEDFIVEVFVGNREGQCVNIKVAAQMTAKEVVDQVVNKAHLAPDNWGLHEMICHGDLERVLHHGENVLQVLMNWVNWHADFTVQNYLCVKENVLYENIELVMDTASPMFSELKLSERKAFKKFCFEFKQSKLSYFKSPQATNVISSWNVEDLLVYVGTEHKRSPPTKYCFTFVEKLERVIKSRDSPFFGRTIACNNAEEFYKWLAGMISAQHPGGLYPEGHTTIPNVRRTSLQTVEGVRTSSPKLGKTISKIYKRK
ncbi:arf-GAP with Rho-GAP domain, ANK repeat and PH domain-containing protein 1-like isoform X2 [Tubulanus polymorphus]|uniref:arf-GAP with Rho-GAP domain, ANK repeat and PH domain-containing protein 1-like isoform X2 n=1 Tax=Tubulanus polymorphus TaxID=672921 RepID=UPI003DA47DE7